MSAPARRLLGNLALSAGAVIATLLVMEVALRAVGYTPESYPALGHVANGRRTLSLDCFPSNPRRYFDIDLRDPATRARYKEEGVQRVDAVASRVPWAVECRFNALRFRDAELGPKPPGVLRVMVLGDSFTEAQGVNLPDTLTKVLERLLNRNGPERWEVRNCGRRATDFPALYETFEMLLAYDPDIVVYAMVLNDAERSAAFEARQKYLNDWIIDMDRMAEEGPPPVPGLFDSRLFALAADRVRSYRIGKDTTSWYRDMYGAANGNGWEQTQTYMREMNRRMRERGGRFLVLGWPLLVGLEGGYPFADVNRTIERFCLSAGIPRLDLLPVLSGRPSSSLWVHPLDHHPNEIANRLAAEAAAPVVRGMGRELAR
jgi:hypothetical protein